MSGTKTVFGSRDGTALTLYKGYPEKKRTGTSTWEITFRYWCNLESAESLLPAHRSACPINGHTDKKLMEASIVPQGDKPSLVDVVLVYKTPGAVSVSSHDDGEVVQTADVSTMEVDIDDSRLVSSGLYTSGEIADLKAEGVRTVDIGSTEYVYTSYAASFTWSEANITTGVGATGAPTGLSSATADNWKLVGYSVRLDGDLTEVSKRYKYSSIGWKV